ncbi:nitrilase [Marinobacterium halophilum]|uniref:Nitrilase n=1 Tax=Marinobacterium halophilum TaxID=267374 RepID=A0A2P8ESR9_9GAMM|nr:carbon-nitrogen hydrolase family protein [Marinobacterium halophilum]PSL12520.1 nitrilase [Marinobacterium halophilum]
MVKVAVIQASPIFLDRDRSIQKAADLIREVSAQGAQLALFPEAFIPGYPAWIWRLRPGGDWGLCESLHARLFDNAVDVSAHHLDPIREAARDTGVTVVCGLNERDGSSSRTTLYNSLVTISAEGELINHHRKLMPTNPERMVWGLGDARGLKVLDTPVGRIGALICWENYMPQARLALYGQGVEVYLAPTYDSGDGWLATLGHIAREGRCWVLCCGVAIERSDLPEDFPDLDRLYPADEHWINPGDSVVVAPGGEIVAGPLHQQKGCLLVDIELAQVGAARRVLDVAGHYARPDIFTLTVNRQPQSPLAFED